MRFCFIAVNYNGSAHTKRYLESVRRMHRSEGDVIRTIIVDNNSISKDLEDLRDMTLERFGEQLLPLPVNVGYFKGLNAGIDACGGVQEYDYLIVGNNDLEFDQFFLSELRTCVIGENAQVLAPDVTTLDGRRQNPLAIRKLPMWQKLRSDLYFSNYYLAQLLRFLNSIYKWMRPSRKVMADNMHNEPMPINRGIGACYVLTPAFFSKNKRLDDRVFLWGEEALLSNQVESTGGQIIYCPALKVTHCESASVRFVESRARYEIVKTSYKIYRDYL